MSVEDKRSGVYSALLGGLDVDITVGIHEDVGSEDHDGLTNAQLGAIHEFGAEDIPQRSFIRAFVDENQYDVDAWVDEAANAILAGADPQEEADIVALRMESGMKERILSGLSPGLSESTKRKRGDDAVPLIDTSQMLGSIRGKATIK